MKTPSVAGGSANARRQWQPIDSHFGAWNEGAGGIGDGSDDLAGFRLRKCIEGAESQQRNNECEGRESSIRDLV